jgi:hypothetical protein
MNSVFTESYAAELKAIIACGQSDGYVKAWAEDQLRKK